MLILLLIPGGALSVFAWFAAVFLHEASAHVTCRAEACAVGYFGHGQSPFLDHCGGMVEAYAAYE